MSDEIKTWEEVAYDVHRDKVCAQCQQNMVDYGDQWPEEVSSHYSAMIDELVRLANLIVADRD